MRFVEVGTIDEQWEAIPLVLGDGKKAVSVSIPIEADKSEVRHWIRTQESEPVPIGAFANASPPGTEVEWPETPVFVFRRRVVALRKASPVPRRPDARSELLLRLKKWVFLRERELRRLERDVERLAAVVDEESPSRTPIPSETRQIVFGRDRGRCVMCGATDDLQFDHIIPVAKGGGNAPENIQILCGRCNREKSDRIV